MKTKVSLFLISILILSGITSCFKNEEYPLEPIISFDEFIIFGENDSAKLIFDFTDGDGDVGLAASDTLPPFHFDSEYHYNLFIEYYEKNDINGWEHGKDFLGEEIVFKYRIKPILSGSKPKAIKGKIEVSLNIFFNPFSSDSDTIKYRFQLFDRALNKSNWAESNEIVLN